MKKHTFMCNSNREDDLRCIDRWAASFARGQLQAAIAIFSFLLLVGNNAVAAAAYQILDIGTLGGTTSTGWALNDSGAIAGTSNIVGDNSNFDKAFKYSANGLSSLGTLGGFQSEARGINSSGSIAGWSTTSRFGPSQAYLYSGGIMTNLGTLGGTSSYGYGINDREYVTGTSNTVNGKERAFLWNGVQMTNLGTLTGNFSNGRKINSQNHVVGVSDNSTSALTYHGFLYQNGTLRDIGTLGGALSSAYDLNEYDQVVGWSTIPSADNIVHAFLYQDGTMLDLGTLGGTYSYAFGINNRTQVVGQSYTLGDSSQHGFLYQSGTMADLNDLIDQTSNPGWTITYAWDINDAGQIVANGTWNNGPSHALLLTPISSVPEPTKNLLFIAGSLLVLLSLRSNTPTAPDSVLPLRTSSSKRGKQLA